MVTREVQYKYVNPNLAAIASINRADQHMTITLVDIVTGQIVHSASIGKAAKPIHMVHSENWIAYSYWSDKGRRTELGIIELYEGTEEQHTQKVLFRCFLHVLGLENMEFEGVFDDFYQKNHGIWNSKALKMWDLISFVHFERKIFTFSTYKLEIPKFPCFVIFLY